MDTETRTKPRWLQTLYLNWIPFWLFRDASRGNFLLREQNYRYNREQRKRLPAYLFKWAVLCACFLGSYELAHAAGVRAYPVRELLAAWQLFAGVSFAVGMALMSKIAAIWGYLTFVR